MRAAAVVTNLPWHMSVTAGVCSGSQAFELARASRRVRLCVVTEHVRLTRIDFTLGSFVTRDVWWLLSVVTVDVDVAKWTAKSVVLRFRMPSPMENFLPRTGARPGSGFLTSNAATRDRVAGTCLLGQRRRTVMTEAD